MRPSHPRQAAGNQQHIVFIHGMWCHSTSLQRLAQLFRAQQYETHCPDLPCRGGTVSPTSTQAAELSTLSLRDHADHISRYIDTLGLAQPPIIIGHSMGGLIAQMVAARGQACALVLLASAPPAGINTLLPKPAWNCLNVLSTWRFWTKPSRLSWRGAKSALFSQVEPERQRELHDGLLWDSGRTFGEIVFWFLDSEGTTQIHADSITVPVLVAGAGKDGILPSRISRRIAAKYPQAKYVHYPEHGHWLIDEPGTESLVEDTARWLRLNVPGSPGQQKTKASPSPVPGEPQDSVPATKGKYEEAFS